MISTSPPTLRQPSTPLSIWFFKSTHCPAVMGKPKKSKNKVSRGVTVTPSNKSEKENKNHDSQIEEATKVASGSDNGLAPISSTHAPTPASAHGSEPVVNNSKGEASEAKKGTEASAGKKGKELASTDNKGIELKEKRSGFIFMCNAKTKSECYRHQVFGLPKGKLELVEKIKPGTRLFLFDFDLKLMYGVYKSSSKGGLNLVSNAFGGNFPAQVKFKIVEDCLPLPESSFKLAIKENYYSQNKFKPDLDSKQVRKLLALFRPINDASQPAPLQYVEDRRPPTSAFLPPLKNSYRSGHLPPIPAVMDPYKPAHIPEAEDPYRSGAIMHAQYATAPAHVPEPVDPYGTGALVHAPLPIDSRYVLQAPFPTSSGPYAPAPQYVLVDARHLQLAPTSIDPYPRTLPNDAFRQPLEWHPYHETQIASERNRAQVTAPGTAEGELECRADQFPRTEHIVGGHATSELASQRSYLTPVYNNGARTYVLRRDEMANAPTTSRYSFSSGAPAYR